MSPSVSSSVVSPSTSSSAAPDASPLNDRRMLTVVVVLAIIGFFLVCGVIFITMRLKRRRTTGSFSGPFQGISVEREHPAAIVVPFGTPGAETPKFRHTPGSDMRIAFRRPDGAWDFGDPRIPFTPNGVSDLDSVPASPASTASSFPFSHKSRPTTKEIEARLALKAQKSYIYDHDVDVEGCPMVPPPAYGHEHDDYTYGARR